MIASIPVSRMYEAMRQTLDLHWLSGKQGGDRQLAGDTVQKPSLALVGHLNFVHPNRVQVLGCAEMDYLRGLDTETLAQAIRSLFSTELAAIIVSNGEPVPADLLATSKATQTPLFTSPQPSPQLMPVLSHYLTQVLAESTSVHGVMLEVIGIGVMITGDAAVGKSELALELITRGHRLIADDMVDMFKVSPETLETHCPPLLQDFLEVRGLGILNIRTLFGDTAVKLQKNLKLIVHLKAPEEDGNESVSRLDMHASSEVILGVTVPKVRIPVAAGRNLAVLVEVAARNHILRMRGINSAEQFLTRQQQFMDDNP